MRDSVDREVVAVGPVIDPSVVVTNASDDEGV